MNEYSPQFIEEMKAVLLEQKAKLENDLAGLPAHTELGSAMDESAEEVEIDDVNRELISRMKHDLEKISQALNKIDQGTYGFDAAGKMIGEARLRAMPWAETSI